MSGSADFARLLSCDPELRDTIWLVDFLQAVRVEELWCNPDQGFEGPDGFFYLALFSERRDGAQKLLTLEDLLATALEKGCGVAINPDQERPDWYFTYGHLWSLKAFGAFDIDAEGVEVSPASRVVPQGQVALSDPPEDFFPLYARNVLRRFASRAGLVDLKVVLVEDPDHEPQRSLLFSLFREDFASEDQFDAALYMIDWHLPPHYGIRAVAKSSEMTEGLVPL